MSCFRCGTAKTPSDWASLGVKGLGVIEACIPCANWVHRNWPIDGGEYVRTMSFDEDTHEYMLSTGKRFYAYGDMLTIDPSNRLCYGHDGIADDLDVYDPPKFTLAERQEIAEAMIARWQKWAGQ